jgi:hypothetical protein
MSIDQTLPTTTNSSTNDDPKPEMPEKSSRNDNSNPQQGAGVVRHSASVKAASHPHSVSRANLKIPPTMKDARKLFVGGLPPDGTYALAFLNSKYIYAEKSALISPVPTMTILLQ